jgi:hypothetical protein
MAKEPPENDKFSDDESITANLRLRSVSPGGRTLLGFFVFIPPIWRGPVAIVTIVVLAYLLVKVGPAAFHWVKQ